MSTFVESGPMSSAAVPERRQVSRIKAIVGASAGNLIEWYDFYVYAYTSIYFAHAFFPKGDKTSQLLATAGIFAVGFFMRPLGGWLFGWLADTRGRKFSMLASVLLMSAGSLMIACLPTYDAIGAAAPLLLLVARLAQGLSVGGEYGTAATYISEVAVENRRGFYSSFQYVTLIGGQLFALLVLMVLQHALTLEECMAWGWRIPFVIGAVGAVVVMYLRRTLQESASPDALRHKEAGSMLGLLRDKRSVLVAVGLTMGGAVYFYTFTTYMQKYLVNTASMDPKTVSFVMTSALVVFMLMQPVFGLLSDYIGRKRNLLLFSGIGLLTCVPLLNALGSVASPVAAFALLMMALLIGCFYTSISGVAKAELFPMKVRALGVGLTHAIASALFGGTAEYVALWLKSAGSEQLFPWYVATIVAITFVSVVLMPDTSKAGHMKD